MKHLILSSFLCFLLFSVQASDSLVQQESRQYRKMAPSTIIQPNSAEIHPLLKGFSALNLRSIQNSYQENSRYADSLILSDSLNANFWNKILYGTKGLFVLAKKDTRHAMALFSPIAFGIILIIMLPMLFSLFFVPLKLEAPSLPENFADQENDQDQEEDESEPESENSKTSAS
jgi:hypothetical protein